MRLAFLLLAPLLFASVVHANSIDSHRGYLVRGEPVAQGDLFGTVALIRSGQDETPADVEPTTLPARIACSGTLITPTTVLTAGHCVQACPDRDCRCGDDGCQEIEAASLFVAAGLTDLESVWETELVRVADIVLHPGYIDIESLHIPCDERYCTGLDWDSNDLALLHLASPLTTIRPVALYPEERTFDLAGNATIGLAHGYGLPLPPGSEELLREDFYVALLNKGPSEIEQSTQNELLTARTDENAAVCYGDSGGPLYVVEGGTPLVAGVASRLRGDAAGECEGGGVYVLVPAYTQWIENNITGELASPSRGGRGCSASPTNSLPKGLLLTLGFLLFVRSLRRTTVAITGVFILGAVGCGSDGDTSFCTEQYDPTGLACNREYEPIDLQTAEALARAEVPEEAWLWYVLSSSSGVLDPDGRADHWSFTYYLPGVAEPPGGQLLSIQASLASTHAFDPYTGDRIMACIPTEPLPVLDSRQLVHDGIRLLEENGETVQLIDGGYLDLHLSHPCSTFARDAYYAYHNYLSYGGKDAVFDREGIYRSVVDRALSARSQPPR